MGKAISMSLAQAGASVSIADINQITLSAAQNELSTIHSDVIAVKTDFSRENEVQNLISRTVQRFRKIAIIVNNAAKAKGGYRITEMSDKDWLALILWLKASNPTPT